jgi:hypothetical protein
MDDLTIKPTDARSSVWAIPLLCAGLCLLAVCVLIPQSEMNRKLVAERDKLKADLAYVQQQLAVNDQFLQNVGVDPGLAERLAQRQMKEIRQGASVLELKGQPQGSQMSPFLLVSVGTPPAATAYRPPSGIAGTICESARSRLYLSGLGLFMVAGGLVLGASTRNA